MSDVPLEGRFHHFPPNTTKYDSIGVIMGTELLAEGVQPVDLKKLYEGDVVPDLHPLIIYRVRNRGDGDFVNGASISLSDFDRLVVSNIHMCIMRGNERRDPDRQEVEMVESYLNPFRNLRYDIAQLNGQRLKVPISVRVIDQVTELLSMQAAMLFSSQRRN